MNPQGFFFQQILKKTLEDFVNEYLVKVSEAIFGRIYEIYRKFHVILSRKEFAEKFLKEISEQTKIISEKKLEKTLQKFMELRNV